MQFPQRDLTNQFISTSYQDVVQRYISGSVDYLLDGLGYVILGVPTSSVGNLVLTQDQTASYAVSASWSPSGNISISSSYALFSELSNTSSISIASEFSDTASIALFSSFSDTASYAAVSKTASYIVGQSSIKSGAVSSASFRGQTYSASVTFSVPFTSDYSLTFGSNDTRIFSVDTKSMNGFVVNSNSNNLFSGSLYWQAIIYGEFN